ncbi:MULTISPECIES: DNA polymerase [unclassified Bacillus cereus group]|uniref:DNA polymerase n=1 Tax=unclassified Bacillus cereus group TaxID=2750818 RepID=UPI003391F84E
MTTKKGIEKECEKPFKLVTLDVETRGEYGEIFLSGIYDGERFFHSSNPRFILTHLQSLGQEYDLHVYVHFLDFDMSKMLYNILGTDKIDFSESTFINDRVAVCKLNNMTFHDSYKLLPSSLADICESFEMGDSGKMDIMPYAESLGFKDKEDFFKCVSCNDPVLVDYLERDCVSLYNIIVEVIQISRLNVHEFVTAPTVASLSLKIFRKFWKEEYKKLTSTNYNYNPECEYVEQQIRKAYHGGRVEIIKPIAENVKHYDKVSMYPSIMKEMEVPYGLVKTYRLGEKILPIDVYESYKYSNKKNGNGFALVKINIPEMNIPPLPYKFSRKLLFPTGKLWGVWSFDELMMAEDYGAEIEEIQEVYFWPKKEKLFKGFVTYFESMKTNGHGAKRDFAKRILNALYGKFGMRRIQKAFCNVEDEAERIAKGEDYVKLTYSKVKGIKQEFIQYATVSKSAYIQPHVSALITSLGRISHYEMIKEQEAKGNVYYFDTDSVVCDAEITPGKVGKNFGDWDKKGDVSYGLYIQEKFYSEVGYKEEDGKIVAYEKVKAKGIRKDVKENMRYSDFQGLYQNVLDGDRSVKIYQDRTKRVSLLRALTSNRDVEANSLESKSISLHRRKKRLIDYVGNVSFPHHFEDYDSTKPMYWSNDELDEKVWQEIKFHDTPDGNIKGA